MPTDLNYEAILRRVGVQCCAVLAVLASCTSHKGYYSSSEGNSAPTGPTSSTTGTIAGTITNSAGAPLAAAHVVITPSGGTAMAAVTTSSSGTFIAPSVPTTAHAGSVTVTAVPANCPTSTSSSYTGLAANDTVTVNMTIVCTAVVGVVRGTITSSLGGGLAGVGVVVTPHNGTALTAVATSTSGAFVVSSVPVADSTGAVTLTSVPSGCTAPATAANYTGLGFGDTVMVNITVTCTTAGGSGTVSGTVTSILGGGLGGVQVVVTPTGGAALPAVTTTGAGVYSVTHVPLGSGMVTLTGGLPAQCSAPSAVAYTGLTNNGTANANVVAPCQQLGSLTVAIVPSPTLGAVTVTGPGGYAQTLTRTTTLTGLVPGSYVATAASYGVPQAFVGTVYDGAVTGSPATVTAGGTSAVNVSYAMRGGTGTLWLFTTTSPGRWRAITNAQLATSGSVPVEGTVSFPFSEFGWGSAAVDANGTLWVAPGVADTLYGFNPTALGAGNFSSPSVTLNHILAAYPSALAFDVAGNLWTSGTALSGTSTVVEAFTPQQLAAGGQQVPTMSFVRNQNDHQVLGMTFGPHGDLWLANLDLLAYTSTLEAFTPAQLAAGGTQAPTASLPISDLINAMAFDQNWNLWVSLNNTGKVVMFTQSQLATGGVQTPAVTLSGFVYPWGLAFDASGNLWVMNTGTGQTYSFTPFQLAASGTPTPTTTVTYTGAYTPSILVFDPHAGSLPLNGSRVVRRPAMARPIARPMARRHP